MAHITEFQNGSCNTFSIDDDVDNTQYSIIFDHVLDRELTIFYLTLIIQPAGKIIILLWSNF